jgi:hypothetical protein
VTLALPAGSATEWLDANGRLLRQRMDRFQAGLDVIDGDEEAVKLARSELAKPPVSPVQGTGLTELAAEYFFNMSKDVFETLK